MKSKILLLLSFAVLSPSLAREAKVFGCGSTNPKDGRVTVDIIRDLKTEAFVKLVVNRNEGTKEKDYTIVSENFKSSPKVTIEAQDLNRPKTSDFDHVTLKMDSSDGRRSMRSQFSRITATSVGGKPEIIDMMCGIANP